MIGTRRPGVRYLGAVIASVIALNLSTPLTRAAPAAPTGCKCTVTVSPTSGARGTTVAVTGRGFTPHATVTLEFVDAATNRTTFASVTARKFGGFEAVVHVPARAAYGHGWVVARTGDLKARGGVLVTKGCSTVAKIKRKPTSGKRNSIIESSGTGFCPNTRVRIRFRDNKLNWTTLAIGVPIDDAGAFVTSVTIPSDAARGAGYLTVYDASSHQDAKVPFTVKP